MLPLLLPALALALSLAPSSGRHANIRACVADAVAAPPSAALTEALGPERAEEVWERRPPGALPNEKKQAALIDWLSTGPLAADPEKFLYPCLKREPKLLLRAASIGGLRESHAALSGLLREEAAPYRFANAIAHEPTLLLATAPALDEAFGALKAASGLNDEELSRVLRTEPGLLLLRTDALNARLDWLESRLGIARGGRLKRVLQRAPLVLLVATATMEARIACLQAECGVDEAALGPLIVRTPRLLHMPLKHIRTRAEWLAEAGIVPRGDAAALGAFLARQPDYFSMRAIEAEGRLEWLTQLGLDGGAAAAIVRDEPAVLGQPLEQMQLKAHFFLHVIGGSLAELGQVPHLLTCDLAKVPMLRHAFCLANGLRVEPTALLTKGDAVFCMEVAGCNLDELNAFEAAGAHLAFFQGAQEAEA